jgi:hypothetical protein
MSTEILLRPRSITEDYISLVVTEEEGWSQVIGKLTMWNIGEVEVR